MRYARRQGIEETPLEAEVFLVDPATQGLYHLDRTARALWTLLAEPAALEDILATFRDGFPEVPAAELERDLRQALAMLMARGLVVTVP